MGVRRSVRMRGPSKVCRHFLTMRQFVSKRQCVRVFPNWQWRPMAQKEQGTIARIFAHKTDASSSLQRKVNLPPKEKKLLAGHSVRDPPGLIPNPEVKPHVAVILVRCVSPCEVTVLAPLFYQFCDTKSICERELMWYIRKFSLDVVLRPARWRRFKHHTVFLGNDSPLCG